MKNQFANFAVVIFLTTIANPTFAQAFPKEQCSLAVVSRDLDKDQKVCASDVVRDMAKRGHAYQENQMGIASVLALGPGFRDQDALHWFEQAAQRGYAPAQVNLAVMYANGWAVERNYGTALRWLRSAADQGFARASYNLGILYLEGRGVAEDNMEAFRWFTKGAEAGDPGAQSNLGYMYDRGLGCAHNIATAVAWYRKAAEAGDALGENNLADLYLRGEGVTRDYAEALRWFEKAAAQGNTGARIKLGYMQANGLGTPKDPEAAYAWVTAASLAGDARGEYLIPALETLLQPEKVSAARERARKLLSETGQEFSAKAFTP